MSILKRYRVYCSTDSRFENDLGYATPTLCPINNAHSIGAVTEHECIFRHWQITNAESPFSLKHHQVITADATSGNITINVTTATGSHEGKLFVVRKDDSSANTVTIDPAGSETIGGASTHVLDVQGEMVFAISNGTNWLIMTRQEERLFLEQLATSENDTIDHWLFSREETTGTAGGTATANAWTTLPLNTTDVVSSKAVSRSTNTITFVAGEYYIRVSSTFYKTNDTRLRLRNTTDSTTELLSLSQSVAGNNVSFPTLLEGYVTFNATKACTVEYYVTSTNGGSSALGLANGISATNEVYTKVHITRFA